MLRKLRKLAILIISGLKKDSERTALQDLVELNEKNVLREKEKKGSYYELDNRGYLTEMEDTRLIILNFALMKYLFVPFCKLDYLHQNRVITK